MQAQGGRGLLRPVGADQSEQTELFRRALKEIVAKMEHFSQQVRCYSNI